LAFLSGPSVFCVHKSAAEVRNVAVFELFPGELAASVTRWNPGSVYICKIGFAPFARLVREVAPTLKWQGATRLRGAQLQPLLASLESLGNGLVHARTASDILRLNPGVRVPEEQAALCRAYLIRSVEDVSEVVWRALRGRPATLWVLGPVSRPAPGSSG
jgi:hypothetical protein